MNSLTDVISSRYDIGKFKSSCASVLVRSPSEGLKEYGKMKGSFITISFRGHQRKKREAGINRSQPLK